MGASGKPNDLLLVMSEEYLTDTLGRSVRNTLEMPVPAMPQIEPSMNVQTVASKNFDGFLRYVRNILIVEIDRTRFTKNSLKYAYDTWASGQIVATLNTPNADSLRAFLQTNGTMMVNLFVRSELRNVAQDLCEGHSSEADAFARELFGMHFYVPQNIKSYKKGQNFLWMSNDLMRRRQDIMLYTLPYQGRIPTAEELLQARDSVLALYLPGGTPGSHARTAPYEILTREIQQEGRELPLVELRGMWEMTGGEMMGGPFAQMAYTDADKGLIYVAEGFVYYPNENKRDLFLPMQAALFTLHPAGAQKGQDNFSPNFIRTLRWTPYRNIAKQ